MPIASTPLKGTLIKKAKNIINVAISPKNPSSATANVIIKWATENVKNMWTSISTAGFCMNSIFTLEKL